MTISRFPLVLLTVVMWNASAGDEPNAIDPSDHRATIRQKLLELTPLGESFSKVSGVLNEKFASPEKAPAFDVKLVPSTRDPAELVKSIRVDLGQFLANPLTLSLPIPLPIVADTSATWIFDEKEVLVEISVSKKLESEFDKD